MVVPHDLVVQDVHADLREALREPLRVRVRDLPEEQFRPDGDELSTHQALGVGVGALPVALPIGVADAEADTEGSGVSEPVGVGAGPTRP